MATSSQRFVCLVCGYIYDEATGDPEHGLAPGTRFADIPDDWMCPDCHVTKADFIALADVPVRAGPEMAGSGLRGPGLGRSEAGGSETGGARRLGGPVASRLQDPARDEAVVIVGAGMAGWAVAEGLRARDPACPIRLLATDHGDYYVKPQLSTGFAKGLDAQAMIREPGAIRAQRLGIELLPFVRALAIDRTRRRVITPRGGIPYARLVLATGAQPRRLRLPGTGFAPLMLNDLRDYRRLRTVLAAHPGGHVAIIGAGLVGCELAEDLRAGGFEVTLLEQAQRPLERLLPDPLSADLAQTLMAGGIRLRSNAHVVERLEAPGTVQRLRLADGEVIEADAVIAALGILPQTQLAQAAGLACHIGIGVNDRLQTEDLRIFALGDCIEQNGLLQPYVTALREQAEVLCAQLVGEDRRHQPRAAVVVVKTPSLPLTVCPPPAGASGRWQSVAGGAQGRHMEYREQGRLLGFALSGPYTAQARDLEAGLQPPQQAVA